MLRRRRYAAERVGIDTGPVFDEVEAKSTPQARDILKNARAYSAEGLADFVKRSGPVIWLSDFTDAMAKVRVTRSGELFLNDEMVSFDELKKEFGRIRQASGIVFCES